MSALRVALKKWYDPAALPIFVVVGGAMVGAGWYVTRLARGPEVVWDRRGNPYPWQDVKEGQNTKMMQVNQKFDSKWKRDKL